MNIGEAARRAGVKPATLRRWARDGVIPQYDGDWTPAAVGHARVVARMRERGHSLQVAHADSRFDTAHVMLDGLRILVAEDNEINQLVISATLAQLGHTCDIARDGLEVLAMVEAGHYDLVLMDIQMPNLDGLSATRAIRALETRTAHIPIIALTANTMLEDRETYIAAGMDDHVAKPIEAKKLARAITNVLARQRQPQH